MMKNSYLKHIVFGENLCSLLYNGLWTCRYLNHHSIVYPVSNDLNWTIPRETCWGGWLLASKVIDLITSFFKVTWIDSPIGSHVFIPPKGHLWVQTRSLRKTFPIWNWVQHISIPVSMKNLAIQVAGRRAIGWIEFWFPDLPVRSLYLLEPLAPRLLPIYRFFFRPPGSPNIIGVYMKLLTLATLWSPAKFVKLLVGHRQNPTKLYGAKGRRLN